MLDFQTLKGHEVKGSVALIRITSLYKGIWNNEVPGRTDCLVSCPFTRSPLLSQTCCRLKVSVTSPIGLFTPIMKPEVSHLAGHLDVLEPEVTASGREIGAVMEGFDPVLGRW